MHGSAMHSEAAELPHHAELRQSRRSGAASTSASASAPATAATTTPLRRISRGSLVALSASRTRETDLYGPTLGHLAPAFAELAEAVEDLAVNMEALDAINTSLDVFNEAFAGLLVGLRVNAYTSDFLQVRRCFRVPMDISPYLILHSMPDTGSHCSQLYSRQRATHSSRARDTRGECGCIGRSCAPSRRSSKRSARCRRSRDSFKCRRYIRHAAWQSQRQTAIERTS